MPFSHIIKCHLIKTRQGQDREEKRICITESVQANQPKLKVEAIMVFVFRGYQMKRLSGLTE